MEIFLFYNRSKAFVSHIGLLLFFPFFLVISEIVAQNPLPNPDLVQSCPYNIIFVLDESGSIVNPTGGGPSISPLVRTGSTNLISSLIGTDSRVAIVEFNSIARRAVIAGSTAYQTIDNNYLAAFNDYINLDSNNSPDSNRYDPEDYSCQSAGLCYTNWEDAFNKIEIINGTEDTANLVIFFTDGNPTAYNNSNGSITYGQTNAIIQQALLNAIGAANAVKLQGSHIFIVGIPNPTLPETNIQAISGPDKYPDMEPDFLKGDYSVSSSSTLAQDLAGLGAFELPTVNVDGVGVSCANDSVFWVASATPGTGSTIVHYQWKLNGIPVGNNSPFFSPTQSGNYSIEVMNENGCKALGTKRLLHIPPPQVVILGFDSLCFGDSVLLTAYATSGSGTIDSYQWKHDSVDAGSNIPTHFATQGGNYSVVVTNSNNCASQSAIKTITDTCTTNCNTQDIQISTGWNMISSYILPDQPDVLAVINKIAQDIIIIKDGLGRAAIPSLGINSIGNWKGEFGYKLKATKPVVLTLGCTQFDPQTTLIFLSSEWNLIAYLRTSPMNVLTALSSLNPSNIIIVKNIFGDSYLPDFGINTIGDMLPGQAYRIKVQNPDTLIYPPN